MRCDGSASSTASSCRRSCQRCSSGAIATSWSIPLGSPRTGTRPGTVGEWESAPLPAGWCVGSTPRRVEQVEPMDDCLLASERGNRAREAALRWCREHGLLAWSRGGRPGGGRARDEERERQADAPAQGNARRSREQRTGPAPDGRPLLRNLVVREGRHSGKLQVRLVSTDGELEAGAFAAALVAELGRGHAQRRAVDALRRARGDHRRRGDRARMGRGGVARAPRRARPAHLLGGVLSDQHRDGGGPVRDCRRLRGPGGLGARV